MKRRSMIMKAAGAAAAVSSCVAASPADAQTLRPACVAGPLYAPYATDFGLISRARMICGVFGEKPHTVKVELWGASANTYTVKTAMWIPGAGFWELGAGLWNVYWGKQPLPANWKSCVTVQPYDGNSYFQRCIKAKSYRYPNLSLAFIRGTATETHAFK